MSDRKKDFADFWRVREEVDIEQVLRHYGLWPTLKGRGTRFRGPCPIHGGSNPREFAVDLQTNRWRCFGDCDGGGGVIDFVVEMDQCDVRTAGLRIAEWFGLPVTGRDEKP